MKKTIKIILISAAALILVILTVLYQTGVIYDNANHTISELQVGKYYLLRNDGYDENVYIQVLPNEKIKFVGTDEKGEFAEDGSGFRYNWNEPTPYELDKYIPFIGIQSYCTDIGENYTIGIGYEDKDTLWTTFEREGNEDIPDFNHYPDEPDKPRYDEMSIIVHYVYEDKAFPKENTA